MRRPSGRIHLWEEGAERRAERLHAELCGPCDRMHLRRLGQSEAIKRNQAQSSAIQRMHLHRLGQP